LLIDADGEINSKRAQLRANWEANVRAAQSQEVNVTVQGFFEEDGVTLWEPNKIVEIFAPALYLNPPTEMLITGVNYELSESGSKTTLNLKRPDAFTVEPAPTVKGDKKVGFVGKGVSVAEAQK
jgi:prophage tail gpP-like protein